MKIPRIAGALGALDDDLISEAASYVPMHRGGGRWLRIAACIALVGLAVGLLVYHNTAANPFVVTAYAQESDGSLTPCVMKENESLFLSKIVTSDGFEGFLFSYPLEDSTEVSEIMPLHAYALTQEGDPVHALFDIIEPYGLQYFSYIPTSETEEEMPLVLNIRRSYGSDNLNKQSDYYQIEVTLTDGGCYVVLEEATQGVEGFQPVLEVGD